MVRKEIGDVLFGQGYRFCQGKPEDLGIFYKYYQEGFHVVLVMNVEQRYGMTSEQHNAMVERVTGMFYHPQGILSDFPEGFPVYHVEVLTLFVGNSMEELRWLCGNLANAWGYLLGEQRLLIYENQPGDFWGLRQGLEMLQQTGEINGKRTKIPLFDRLKGIKNMPYVTIALIAVNVLVFVILEYMGDTTDGFFIASHGGMYPSFILNSHQWWRLVTAEFLHFGAAHLMNNMVMLYFIGERLEATVGHIRYLVIYFCSMLGAGLFSLFMMIRTGDVAVSAGASGAVFGVIGGLLWAVILYRGKLQGLTTKRMIASVLLMLYYGFASSGVDNWGHVGGLVTGFVITVILYHRKRQKC